jgi:hypothetical protein
MQRPGGRRLMVLGLSGENVARLAAGEPILFDAAQLGFDGLDVLITYGRTEAVIAEVLGLSGENVESGQAGLLPDQPD